MLEPNQIDFHCHNRIFSALFDHPYDVYHITTSAKDFWNSLEAYYGIINQIHYGIENKFIMVDEKPISNQIHEF